MSKSKMRLIVLPMILALVFLLSATVIIAVAGEKTQWSGESVDSAYGYGEKIAIPVREIGGDGTAVSHSLVFPSGTSTYADSVTLSEYGIYTLIYTAKVNGKAYSETFTFTVANPLYSVSGNTSAVHYGALENVRNAGEGLIVSLAKGDTLTFNKAIALEDLSLDQSFVEGFILPYASGQSGFSKFTVTLTDMENPDIYFTIRISERDVGDIGRSYMLGGGNGQDMVGARSGQGSNDTSLGGYTNEFGQVSYFPFSGIADIGGKNGNYYRFAPYNDDYLFRFFFDPDTKEVWHSTNYLNPKDLDNSGILDEEFIANGGNKDNGNKDNVQIINNNWSFMITDLDSTNLYRTIWSGFESGYVKLSIKADGYNSDMADFCITKVCGMDLSADSFEITNAPEISVENAEDLPEAKTGMWYQIPEASARDLYFGDVDVTAKVIYNYIGTNSIAVSVDNGRFFAERPGYYAIVYTATNNVGVSAEKLVFVHASADVKPVEIGFDEATKITSGSILEFIDYADAILTEGSGNITLRVYAKLGDRIIETEGGFRPDTIGKWQVVYEATDEIGQISSNYYEVDVAESDKYILLTDIELPLVFISGGKYKLPEAVAAGYENGNAVEKICDVSVTVNGTTKTYKAGEVADITVQNSGDTVFIKYSCGTDELYSKEVATVKPYTDSVLDYTEYFVTENAIAEATENACIIKLRGASSSFYYANPVVAEGIDLVLRTVKDKTNYSEIVVTLIDTADYNNRIEAKFIVVDDIVTMSVGENQYKTGYKFTQAPFDLNVNYSNGNLLCGTVAFPVKNTIYGENFEGFKSDKVYVDVKINNITSESEIGVVSMRSYTFGNQTDDLIEPYNLVSAVVRKVNEGDKFTIPALVAGDMISPGIKGRLTVTAPDKSIVTNINGVLLKDCDPFVSYTFTAEMPGRYRITYVVEKDNNFGVRGYEKNYAYSLNVLDSVNPEIKITSDWTREANVGDTIICPSYTVSDNVTETKEIITYISIVFPTGQVKIINGNSIKVSLAGVYKLHIVAIDAAGNMAIEEIEVRVK